MRRLVPLVTLAALAVAGVHPALRHPPL